MLGNPEDIAACQAAGSGGGDPGPGGGGDPGDEDPNDEVSNTCTQDFDYCVTGSGVVIDWDHYSPQRVAQLLAMLKWIIALGGNSLSISGWLTPIGLVGITVEYIINVPTTASDSFIEDVLLGVWLDFQQRFEYAQGLFPVGSSSFSPEDLVSNYLGFYDGVTGVGASWIVAELGGGFGTNDKYPYIGTEAQTSLDVYSLPES